MKQTQRDIKYIIKRILIGVGIAIILFNLKKCNVYADTIYYSMDYVGNAWSYSSSNISSCTKGQKFTFDYNGTTYNICASNNYNYAYTHIFVFEYNGVPYIRLGSVNTNPTATKIVIPSNNSYFDLYNNDTAVASIDINAYTPMYFYNGTGAYINITRIGNNSNNYDTYITNSYFKQHIEDFTFIYSDLDLPIYYNDTLINPTDPLSDYTQVDLTGYQAALLVPKNYQTMLSDSSHTNESPPGTFRTYLDLEYYSQECVRGTLINVENVQDIMLNNIGVGTGNIAESVTGTCYQEPTQTVMSYEFDQYSGLKARGLLVYNGSQDWQSGFGTETPFFGTSYVWYDPTMYNAYLVKSFDNFNQTISYKDYSGEDKEVTIESLPTFTESMENAIENVDSPTPTEVNKQKLQVIFEFLKSPFSFLNKLNTTSCTPIDLPFPRSNQNIHLECLSSSVYDRYLPTALKSIIIIIINGLLFYRCTLSNIDIFTDILDPEDNKLEAVQL